MGQVNNEAQKGTIAAQKISQKGLDFIKKHEKLRLKPYDASGKRHAGDWTIGYGHKIKAGENFSNGITKQRALSLLKQDVQTAVGEVNAGLRVSVSQNQFDALVSLAFNAGPGSVAVNHEMMRAINLGWVHEENFTQYDKVTVNGEKEVSPGLLRRREEEWQMFSGGGP
jgi:GH24 family phage-related lysozyme (muramidase)